MKNRPFVDRLGCALKGIKNGWETEASFRWQAALAVSAVAFLLILRPAAVWWAIFLLVIAAVLAAELFNAALEHVIDRLHPEIHPAIARSKDCAAGAVLILSLAAVGIFVTLVIETFPVSVN
jgi:diacylglycerol kinase (ATP)